MIQFPNTFRVVRMAFAVTVFAALTALCAHAAAPGRLERIAVSPELRKELGRYGLEAGRYVQPKAGCASAAASRERHRRVTGRPFPSSLSYLLYVPKGQKSRKVPLLIYLPGSGERGEDLLRQFHQRTIFKRITSGEFQARHPCYMLALSPPEGVGTFLDGEPGRPSAIQDLIAGAVSAVVASRRAPPVDRNRLYATGLSLGGEGVYGLAFAYPGLIAAGIPVAAAPPPADYLPPKRPGYWWHFYNEGDYRAKRIDPAALDVFRKAVEVADGEFRTGTYPATGHNAWDAAWREEAVWEWLFSKTANGRPAEPSRPTSSKKPAPAAKSPTVICTASRPGRDGGTGPERAADGLDGTAYVSDRPVGKGDWLQAEFPDGVSGRMTVRTGTAKGGKRLTKGHLAISTNGRTWERVGRFSRETGECTVTLRYKVRFIRILPENDTPQTLVVREIVVTRPTP